MFLRPSVWIETGLRFDVTIAGAVVGREVRFLASLYSFGVLLTFTAAQVAVVRLRFREPDLERPFRAPGNVRIRGRLRYTSVGHRCRREARQTKIPLDHGP